MSSLHDADGMPVGFGPHDGAQPRLSRGLAFLVICALSALSWAILISIVMALQGSL